MENDFTLKASYWFKISTMVKVKKMKRVVFHRRKRMDKKFKKRYDLYLAYQEEVPLSISMWLAAA